MVQAARLARRAVAGRRLVSCAAVGAARAPSAAFCGGLAAAVVSGGVACASAYRELRGECVIVCEATCRTGAAMDSPICTTLPPGERVEVLEHADVTDGRGTPRRRLCVRTRRSKEEGWLSEVAGQGVRLITTSTPPSAEPPAATIRMYTTQRCPWCVRAKELLAAKARHPRPPSAFPSLCTYVHVHSCC